jgi:prephenate dehydrogenase
MAGNTKSSKDKSMNVAIIGTGLIGGSLALVMRDMGIASHFIGVEINEQHAKRALELGIVDELSDLENAVKRSDLVIVAIPVHAAEELLPGILNHVSNQVVMDVSSTKKSILNAINDHPMRKRFVATHPMWGTEYSGPDAAVHDAFRGKVTVISGKEQTDKDAVEIVENIYNQIGMRILYMDPSSHDIHAAYVSHISHITSFALANTVLEKEKEEDTIFAMASAGFESTVRLAKSNPAMWVQIFMQNRENILDVLNEHISQLRKFKSCLEKENETYLEELIVNANKIRKILK